jgi:hypothetical protein
VHAALRAAMERLDRDERAILALRYVAGFNARMELRSRSVAANSTSATMRTAKKMSLPVPASVVAAESSARTASSSRRVRTVVRGYEKSGSPPSTKYLPEPRPTRAAPRPEDETLDPGPDYLAGDSTSKNKEASDDRIR